MSQKNTIDRLTNAVPAGFAVSFGGLLIYAWTGWTLFAIIAVAGTLPFVALSLWAAAITVLSWLNHAEH